MGADLTKELKETLISKGADLVGIGSLEKLSEDVRYSLPIGVSVAVKYPKKIIQGISELPTQSYKNWYDSLNEQLDILVSVGADLLQSHGYQAVAQTMAQVGEYGDECCTTLPHKTVATRAGVGWVGKCALLVTKQYGSMIRLSSILTNAPLEISEPINKSMCGNCTACVNACPAGAVYGKEWNQSLSRDELFDYQQCRITAQNRSEQGFGQRVTLCGKCIEICPYTQRYLKFNDDAATMDR